MAAAFNYRPKFIDIRASKRATEEARPLQPGERACDHMGCARAGECRAPKGRERLNEYWWFCAEHAADYNRRWNFFAGMSEDDLREFERQAWVGHRPTWAFKAGRGDREAAAFRAFQAGRMRDRFGVFEGGKTGPDFEPRPRHNRTQLLALEVLGLEQTADAAAIRNRYAELVKRYHPDSNGGDRSAEERLNKVIKAYQLLKHGGLV